MSDILSIAVTALRADQSRLEQLSLNAANASMPGYRRSTVASTSFDRLMSADETQGAAAASPLPSTPLLTRGLDLTAGALNQTGRSLDLAVEGEGFLALTDGNQTWLTRAGALKVDEQGQLTNSKGLRVLGDRGEIRPGTSTGIVIDADGTVRVGEQSFGKVRLVQPADPTQLSTTDGVLFQAGEDQLKDVDLQAGRIRSGYLEASNTNSLREVLGVMEGTRHFESLIRLVQGYDEVLGKTIQKLGEV